MSNEDHDSFPLRIADLIWVTAACLCAALVVSCTQAKDSEAEAYAAGLRAGRLQLIDSMSDAYSQGARDGCATSAAATAPDATGGKP